MVWRVQSSKNSLACLVIDWSRISTSSRLNLSFVFPVDEYGTEWTHFFRFEQYGDCHVPCIRFRAARFFSPHGFRSFFGFRNQSPNSSRRSIGHCKSWGLEQSCSHFRYVLDACWNDFLFDFAFSSVFLPISPTVRLKNFIKLRFLWNLLKK